MLLICLKDIYFKSRELVTCVTVNSESLRYGNSCGKMKVSYNVDNGITQNFVTTVDKSQNLLRGSPID